ncbi:unnamed protein product, partial [Polarella glacialis]
MPLTEFRARPPPMQPAFEAFSQASGGLLSSPSEAGRTARGTAKSVRRNSAVSAALCLPVPAYAYRRQHSMSMSGEDDSQSTSDYAKRVCRRQSLTPGLDFLFEDAWNGSSQDMEAGQPSLLRNRAYTEDLKSNLMEIVGDTPTAAYQVERFRDHGYTMEDMSRVLYDHLKHHEMPDFLDEVILEPQGGLDKLPDVMAPQKYFWFFVLIFS